MIDEKQIQRIADLVKIKLTTADLKKYQKQLGSILDYVNHLQKVDVQDVELYQDASFLGNFFREDQASVPDPESNLRLLREVPEKDGDFIKTKNPLK